MKIVIAPQTFKGCAAGSVIAEAMARGIRQVFPHANLVMRPVGDGGDGTLDVLLGALGGQRQRTRAVNACGEERWIEWGIVKSDRDPPLAIIEMARICGLHDLDPIARNPLFTTTYGVGTLIRQALDPGCRQFFIGLGGSATNDAGCGLLQALGIRFLKSDAQELGWGGAALADLAHIDLALMDPRLQNVQITVGCDVNNPLLGSHGATRVYAEQKGATPAMVVELEKALSHFAGIVIR